MAFFISCADAGAHAMQQTLHTVPFRALRNDCDIVRLNCFAIQMHIEIVLDETYMEYEC